MTVDLLLSSRFVKAPIHLGCEAPTGARYFVRPSSRHFLGDDPDKIHFGLTHLGDRDTVRTPGRSGRPVQVLARADAEAAKQGDTVRPNVQAQPAPARHARV